MHFLSTMASKTDYCLILLIKHVMYVGKKEVTTRALQSNYESLTMTRITLKYSTMVIIFVKKGNHSNAQRKWTKNQVRCTVTRTTKDAIIDCLKEDEPSCENVFNIADFFLETVKLYYAKKTMMKISSMSIV